MVSQVARGALRANNLGFLTLRSVLRCRPPHATCSAKRLVRASWRTKSVPRSATRSTCGRSTRSRTSSTPGWRRARPTCCRRRVRGNVPAGAHPRFCRRAEDGRESPRLPCAPRPDYALEDSHVDRAIPPFNVNAQAPEEVYSMSDRTRTRSKRAQRDGARANVNRGLGLDLDGARWGSVITPAEMEVLPYKTLIPESDDVWQEWKLSRKYGFRGSLSRQPSICDADGTWRPIPRRKGTGTRRTSWRIWRRSSRSPSGPRPSSSGCSTSTTSTGARAGRWGACLEQSPG